MNCSRLISLGNPPMTAGKSTKSKTIFGQKLDPKGLTCALNTKQIK